MPLNIAMLAGGKEEGTYIVKTPRVDKFHFHSQRVIAKYYSSRFCVGTFP